MDIFRIGRTDLRLTRNNLKRRSWAVLSPNSARDVCDGSIGVTERIIQQYRGIGQSCGNEEEDTYTQKSHKMEWPATFTFPLARDRAV